MSAIVKANSNLSNGGLAVLKRSFSTNDTGLMTYAAEYCCLSQHANKWTPFFKTGAQPPTALPQNVLQLQLTKTPTLSDLQTETANGLTYFRATYSAGVSTSVVITEESEQRSFSGVVTGSYSIISGNGNTLTSSGFVTISFDYISTTVTASSLNANLPAVKGSVGYPFNRQIGLLNGNQVQSYTGIRSTTIESTSKARASNGEYNYSLRSTGVYEIKQPLTVNTILGL